MKYWERWIGDWKRKTAHLSAEAKGIYGELLDHVYATQKPLPEDVEEVYRIAGASTASERKATERVLRDFFPNGMNPRATEEIARRDKYVAEQRERANKRWHMQEHEPVHEQAQEQPIKRTSRVNGASFTLPEWINAEQFNAWAKSRGNAAKLAAIHKLDRFREKGLDPNAIIAESLANGWKGIFEPKQISARKSIAEANAEAAAEATRRFHEEHGQG